MSETGNGNGRFGPPADRAPPELPWEEYKRAKAHAFVDRGYSVEWSPDEGHWMKVYIPQRSEDRKPSIEAMAKIYEQPSKFGIDGGRISKLSIQTSYVDVIKKVLGHTYEQVVTLYNYDRGPDVDRLRPGTRAHRLFRDVIDVLN